MIWGREQRWDVTKAGIALLVHNGCRMSFGTPEQRLTRRRKKEEVEEEKEGEKRNRAKAVSSSEVK